MWVLCQVPLRYSTLWRYQCYECGDNGSTPTSTTINTAAYRRGLVRAIIHAQDVAGRITTAQPHQAPTHEDDQPGGTERSRGL